MSLSTTLAGISPFGPIFGKELRTTARRKRTYLLRVVYLALLLIPLVFAYFVTYAERQFGGGVAMRNQEQSQLGQVFFAIFSVFSVWMMGLLGPVLTANAISAERLQKTLPVLLMTPISAWQIVAGKLFSRLLVAFTLIGLGLPMLALVRLLGGVELTSMVGVIALALVAAMSAAAIGLFFSTLLNRAYAVILLSIGAMLFLYVFVPMVIGLTWHAVNPRGGPSMGMIELIMAINPYWMVFAAAMPDFSIGLRITLPWGWCLGLHVGLTAALLMWSAMIVRRRARRSGAVNNAPAWEPAPNMAPPPLPGGSGSLVVPYATPQARGARRERGEVSDNPILWRETRRPLLARVWQRVVAICIVVGLLLLMYLLLGFNDGLKEPDAQIGWAIGFNALFCILTLVISSTAIAQEKESDTWTLLTATPISGRTIIWGKALGVMRRLLWPFVFVAGHFAVFVVFGVTSPAAAVLALWIIFSANTIWIATGVYFSLRFKHVTVAVIANLILAVSLYLVVLGILGMLGAVYDRNPAGDDIQPRMILKTVLGIVGLLIAGWWLFTLFQAFARPRGALGRLMIVTLLLIVVLATAMSAMQSRSEPVEQSMWYTPYVLLAELPWKASREFELRLPNETRLFGPAAWLYCLAFGLVHILLSGAVLGLASLKFSRIVGRAPQGQAWFTRRQSSGGPGIQPILSDGG